MRLPGGWQPVAKLQDVVRMGLRGGIQARGEVDAGTIVDDEPGRDCPQSPCG